MSLPLQLREARTRGIPGGERALDLTCAESRQDPAYQAQVQGADNAGTLSGDALERTGVQSDTGFGIRGFEFRIEPHLREQGGDDERRFFAELCRRLPGADARSPIAALIDEPRLLGNPTPRELELLGYIDAGLTNQQLADRTDVTLTTVKWHLQNLYGKLGVSSRSAALARARALNLLAR